MQQDSQVCERLSDGGGKIVVVDLFQVVLIRSDKTLFYVAVTTQHRDGGMETLSGVEHCYSSVIILICRFYDLAVSTERLVTLSS
jgi:hypothetical protein